MAGQRCKSIIDCNGEIMEAITNVPLLIANGFLSHEAIHAFNEMKARWAPEYLQWKADHINFDDDHDDDDD